MRKLLKCCWLLTMLWYVRQGPQDLVVPDLTTPRAGRSLFVVTNNSVNARGTMKDLKHQSRLATRSPLRSVSLQIRDYQVTLKVKSSVPQVKTPSLARWSFR